MDCGIGSLFIVAGIVLVSLFIALIITGQLNIKFEKITAGSNEELIAYLERHYPLIDEHVGGMLLSDAYCFLMKHFGEPEPNDLDSMAVVCNKILILAKSHKFGDLE